MPTAFINSSSSSDGAGELLPYRLRQVGPRNRQPEPLHRKLLFDAIDAVAPGGCLSPLELLLRHLDGKTAGEGWDVQIESVTPH